jgi:hypothetical protein
MVSRYGDTANVSLKIGIYYPLVGIRREERLEVKFDHRNF